MHYTTTAIIAALLSVAVAQNTLWLPKPGLSWNYQLSKVVTPDATGYQVWDIDLFDTPALTISALKAKGAKIICYFSAGSYESWRPDASKFKPTDLGRAMDGWPGENWIQTRSSNVQSILLARLDLAKQKGCDGVEPDNTDAYNNNNGLGLTQADAIAHVSFLADAAKSRGLAIGLKNSGEIIGSVINKVQFAINEQCVAYNECFVWLPFIASGKAVFHVEYPKGSDSNTNKNVSAAKQQLACWSANLAGFSNIIKNMNLNNWIQSCAR